MEISTSAVLEAPKSAVEIHPESLFDIRALFEQWLSSLNKIGSFRAATDPKSNQIDKFANLTVKLSSRASYKSTVY